MQVSSRLALLAAIPLIALPIARPAPAHAEDVEATPGHQLPTREVTAAPRDGTYLLPPQDPTRTPAWIATGVTGALLIATGVAALTMRSKIERRRELQNVYNTDEVAAESLQLREDTLTWRNITFGTAFVTLASGALTGYMWTRQERPRRRMTLTPQPTQGGAAVSLSGAF